jgi:small subunit ribosomal protein S17
VTQNQTKETARKQRKARVLSNSMDKTIVVEIERIIQHSLYKKYLNRNSRFKVHDEDEDAQPGDFVLIQETRPLSKSKRWRLLDVLEKASTVEREAVTDEESSEAPDTA